MSQNAWSEFHTADCYDGWASAVSNSGRHINQSLNIVKVTLNNRVHVWPLWKSHHTRQYIITVVHEFCQKGTRTNQNQIRNRLDIKHPTALLYNVIMSVELVLYNFSNGFICQLSQFTSVVPFRVCRAWCYCGFVKDFPVQEFSFNISNPWLILMTQR